MSKKLMSYLIVPSALFCLSLIVLPTFTEEHTPSRLFRDRSVNTQFSQKVNLALRQTAHRLLKQAGDSTSTIAPVQKTADNRYFVKLEHPFIYDSLPFFIQNSFNAYEIKSKYEVAVWDCEQKELILGYSSLDFLKERTNPTGSGIPCSGRGQSKDCLNFSVTFADVPNILIKTNVLWFILCGLLLAAIATSLYFYTEWNKSKKSRAPSNSIPIDTTHLIYIGKSIFDTRNQTVSIGNALQKLTFREAKLLQLFCNHQNELLDRDVILKAVWEDEGVLVGRSVDVFVSRLRKILKNDESLKITNVHSRGYRFETEAS